MLDKINRSFQVIKLTRKYFRANQVPGDSCMYYINGVPRTIGGSHALSMLIDIVSNDAYGLKRFKVLDNIVDIGANIGIFSLLASTLFPKARILSYEPGYESRLFLEKNVAGLNVEVFPQAVSNTTGTTLLNNPGDITACYISLEEDVSHLSSGNQECKLTTLDDVAHKLNRTNKISLLKLDCEGSEYEIMQASSLDSFTYIVGELHTCKSGHPELGLQTLKSRGFNIDRWFPFSDGKAGVFWAKNSQYAN